MKKIIIVLLSVGLFLWAALYTSASFKAKAKPQFHMNLSNSIFLWEEKLDGTIIWYKSGMDISEYLPTTTCNTESKFLWEANNIYFYYVRYNDVCANNTLVLQKDGVSVFSSFHTLKPF